MERRMKKLIAGGLGLCLWIGGVFTMLSVTPSLVEAGQSMTPCEACKSSCEKDKESCRATKRGEGHKLPLCGESCDKQCKAVCGPGT